MSGEIIAAIALLCQVAIYGGHTRGPQLACQKQLIKCMQDKIAVEKYTFHSGNILAACVLEQK